MLELPITASNSASRNVNFERPIGAVVSDDELARRIPGLMEESRIARHAAEIKWLIASATLDGYHNNEADWINRRVLVNPVDPKGSIRVQIPELITRFRRDLGQMLSLSRCPSTKPIVTGDPNVWQLNRFGNAAASYIYNASDFPATYMQHCGDLYLCGTAGLMAYWDNGISPEDGLWGEVGIRSIPGWELYPFPAASRDDRSLEGIIWARVVSEEWIKQNIPDAVNEKRTQVTTPYMAVDGIVRGGLPSSYSGYLLRYVFFKPSRRFPQGEQVIMVGDKVYRREGALKFLIGKRRILPIAIDRYIHKPTSWWGEGMGYIVARMNKEINRMMSLLVRRALMKAHPGYMLVPMGSANVDDFKNQIGGIVQYRSSPLNPDASRPTWMTYPAGSAETDVVVNRFDSYMADITSQHSASMGENVGRLTSAEGVNALQRADAIPNETTIRSIDHALRITFSSAIEIGRTNWDKPKLAVISGPAGGPPASVAFQPNQIPSMDQLVVVTGLDLPLDKHSQLQFLNQLSSPRFRGDSPLIDKQEYRRGLMSLGINLPGIDLIDADEQTAWQENLAMYGDGKTPGKIPDPNSLLENSEVHLATHRKFWGSPEVKFTASPEVLMYAAEHVAKTTQIIPGATVPPPGGFDTTVPSIEEAEFAEMAANTMGGSGLSQGAPIPPEVLQQLLTGA